MKNSSVVAVFVAIIGVSLLPASAHAQGNEAPTRAQVRAELAALEQVGYYPAYSHGPDYPLNLQDAQRKVAAQQGDTSQYGSSAAGESEAGSR